MAMTTSTGFERPTLAELVTRISGDINTRISGIANPLTRTAMKALAVFTPVIAATLAAAVYLLYGYIDYVADQMFVATMSAANLDRAADEWGLTRAAATYASGYVRFFGADGTEVTQGRLVQDGSGYRYAATSAGAISGGYADVAVQSEKPGAAYNLDASTALTLVTTVTGLSDSCQVASGGLTGGTDAETDDALRQRLLARKADRPQGGAATDYEQWAEALGVVGQAWCEPQEAGVGTVTVYWTPADVALDPAGAAHGVGLQAVDAGGTYVDVLKAEVAAALGYTPDAGDFAAGVVFFEPTGAADPQSATIDSNGLVTSGSNWRITFASALDTPPSVLETVTVCDADSATVQQTLLDNAPATAVPMAKVPLDDVFTLAISVTPNTLAVQQAIEAAIDSLVARLQSPGCTIFNSAIHGALQTVTEATRYELTDVDGGGELGDIVTAAGHLPVRGTITYSMLS